MHKSFLKTDFASEQILESKGDKIWDKTNKVKSEGDGERRTKSDTRKKAGLGELLKRNRNLTIHSKHKNILLTVTVRISQEIKYNFKCVLNICSFNVCFSIFSIKRSIPC